MSAAELAKLRKLIWQHQSGTLSSEAHETLQTWLSESAEARKEWFVQSDLETGLAEWATARHEKKSAPLIPFPASKSSRTRWQWIALSAAIVVIGLMIWRFQSSEILPTSQELPAQGVAVLSHTAGAQWSDGMERSAGRVLEPGRLKLTEGSALVEFYSGARVVIESPAELELIDSAKAFLHGGKINAHVPPQAHGFTIDSPTATVVDLGTEFGFVVPPDRAAEVHVFTGKVKVARNQQPPQPVNEGQAVRVETAALVAIPTARSAFLTEEQLTQRESLEASARFAAWKKSSATLSLDPAVKLHFVFDESSVAKRSVKSLHAADGPSAAIIGGSWMEGRWPGQRTLAFRSEVDRVRLMSDSPMQALTLLAWVKIEALPRWQNVILSAVTERPGAVNWHLTEHGELRLEIARDLGRKNPDWEAVNSEPFVTANRFGEWLLLATTFDGKTIRHFGNGKLIGSGASFTPPEIKIGTAELGNWSGATQRHLSASMAEFAILARAMTDAEIFALYQAGK